MLVSYFGKIFTSVTSTSLLIDGMRFYETMEVISIIKYSFRHKLYIYIYIYIHIYIYIYIERERERNIDL